MIRSRIIFAMLSAGIAAMAIAPSTAAMASTRAVSHQAAASVLRPMSPTHCPSGDFCTYNNTNGTAPCLEEATSTTTGVSFLTWGAACANLDESLIDNTTGLARVYYQAGEKGAWMCMDGGDYLDNVSTGGPGNGPYIFDNGSTQPGYGKTLWKDIHSSEVNRGQSCTNEE